MLLVAAAELEEYEARIMCNRTKRAGEPARALPVVSGGEIDGFSVGSVLTNNAGKACLTFLQSCTEPNR